MQFDNTPEVQKTEAIMTKIRDKFTGRDEKLPTWMYNRIFEAVLDYFEAGEKADQVAKDLVAAYFRNKNK